MEVYGLSIVRSSNWCCLINGSREYCPNLVHFGSRLCPFRYGDVQAQMMDYHCLVLGKNIPIWWKDLTGLTMAGCGKSNWLTKEILCNLGNGSNI